MDIASLTERASTSFDRNPTENLQEMVSDEFRTERFRA